jgi:hypothetical protein
MESDEAPDMIIDKLYLGDADHSYNKDKLLQLGIKNILTVGSGLETPFEEVNIFS